MPDIVLSTLNAKYIHAAFGLRYLLANMGPPQTAAKANYGKAGYRALAAGGLSVLAGIPLCVLQSQ